MSTFEAFQLWDPTLCAYLRNMALHEQAHEAKIIGQGVQADSEIRSASRYKVADPTILSRAQVACDEHNSWEFRTHWGAEALPHAEIIHYKPGDFYKPHTDWGSTYFDRKVTMVVQLSDKDEYTGGELLLHDGPEPWAADPKMGNAILFPSWTLHEVTPLLSGERWVFVAWVLGPKFE